jgi:hypothetical protein
MATLAEKSSGALLLGGWVGLDAEAREKSFASARDRTPVFQPVV